MACINHYNYYHKRPGVESVRSKLILSSVEKSMDKSAFFCRNDMRKNGDVCQSPSKIQFYRKDSK